ncbi:hypothetical protein PGT21_031729 [Puccinia graminis f. sp. tritici]|uniref:RING-type domain-containing protein n=1 Tax=Puccinia graminis f. sp. tritici TaxID=56615 RepID=A0A5B0NQ31_PUCGR|nr:hypothetical protein PGTUg99_032621 [Puccinia graminis f. sp. tritici]KAA1091345.1 hypothetical protein PGT21_031729 [Puccinia graminis f. sp. tritici]
MDRTSNLGDLNDPEDPFQPSPGGSQTTLPEASAVPSAPEDTPGDIAQMNPEPTPSTTAANPHHATLNDDTEDILAFIRQIDETRTQMPPAPTVSSRRVLQMAEDLQVRRADHEEITGEHLLFQNMVIRRRPRATMRQLEVTNLLDRLENITLGSVLLTGHGRFRLPCSICLEEYTEGDRVVVLQCHESHHFHRDCMQSSHNGSKS